MGKYNFRRTKNIFIFTESGYSSSDRSQCSIGRYNNALVKTHTTYKPNSTHDISRFFVTSTCWYSTVHCTIHPTEQNLRHCFLGDNLTDFFIYQCSSFWSTNNKIPKPNLTMWAVSSGRPDKRLKPQILGGVLSVHHVNIFHSAAYGTCKTSWYPALHWDVRSQRP